MGDYSQFQVEEVRTVIFQPSAPIENLRYFNVLSGYPPDVLHDLFEGIVPRELTLFVQVFIEGKYITLENLNKNV